MKTYYIYFLLLCSFVISCEKYSADFYNEKCNLVDEHSAPMVFATLDEMRNAINSKNLETKSSNFISYAETIMQEDNYYDLPWSINSESFGSVLNIDGEVIFNDVFLKLCKYGIIYAPTSKIEKARYYASLGETNQILRTTTNIPSYLSTSDMTFSFIDDTDIYVYDSFGILTGESCYIDTKVYAPDNKELIEYNYDQSDILVADNRLKWKRNFNVVNGSDQKINFTSKICNDTRIFQDNYGVYSESGVVTKTMKKSAIGTWGKFKNQISAGITDLVLCEEGVSITADPPGLLIVNFLDINKFKVDIAGEVANRELILATVRNYSESQILNMTNSSYNSLKNSIINWAADKGIPVSKLDGIRFYMGDGSGKCYIKLNDEVTSGVAEKYKVLLNYFLGGANIKSKESLLGESITGENNIAGKIHLYHVQKVSMYGYSTYDNQSKGSKLIYNYNHKKYYD